MLQKYFNKSIRLLFRYAIFWKIAKPFISFSDNLKAQKYWADRRVIDTHIKHVILKEPVVRNGFFKGMRYPDFLAAGSAIYPKFIGSYESELTPTLNEILKKKYELIIDVGCAEGYYAVGLAKLMPHAKILAYDTDPRARNLCKQIAVLNKVVDRIDIKGTLTAFELGNISIIPNKTLIISDCEGYEKKLFTVDNIQHLKDCSILIETHDLFDMSISEYLKNLFYNTHQSPIVISSLDDIKKAQTYQYEETTHLDLNLMKIIFEEQRKAIMEWLYFVPKEE